MAGLTEEDQQRIDRFVQTKSYHRTPEMLCPADDPAEDESDDD